MPAAVCPQCQQRMIIDDGQQTAGCPSCGNWFAITSPVGLLVKPLDVGHIARTVLFWSIILLGIVTLLICLKP
jgi:hypothetical protein